MKKKIAGDIIILHMCTKNCNHMRYSSWDNPENRNFEKLKKTSGDAIILQQLVQQKTQSNDVCVCLLRYGVQQTYFLSFYAIFCSFTPLLTLKIKIWKKCKNTWRHYPFTHVHHKPRSYDVWFLRYKVQRTKFFVILGDFLPFHPPNNPKNQNFFKIRKTPGDIILHISTINQNHMMYDSWDMEDDRQNFSSFFIFSLLPLPKNKNFEKMKNNC